MPSIAAALCCVASSACHRLEDNRAASKRLRTKPRRWQRGSLKAAQQLDKAFKPHVDLSTASDHRGASNQELAVQPHVFHPISIVDAVDHGGIRFDIWLPARTGTIVVKHGSCDIVGQPF